MPPSSTDMFLTAPVRAIRSSKRHLYSVFYQEPVRRPLRPLGLLGALRAPGAPGLLKLLKPLKPLKPPIQLK